MSNSEHIGIGIITYNRKESYKRLLDSIKTCDIIDYVITVKDGNIDYNDAEPNIICNEMKNKLIENNIPFEVFKGNIEGYDSIYDKVISLLNARRESNE